MDKNTHGQISTKIKRLSKQNRSDALFERFMVYVFDALDQLMPYDPDEMVVAETNDDPDDEDATRRLARFAYEDGIYFPDGDGLVILRGDEARRACGSLTSELDADPEFVCLACRSQAYSLLGDAFARFEQLSRTRNKPYYYDLLTPLYAAYLLLTESHEPGQSVHTAVASIVEAIEDNRLEF